MSLQKIAFIGNPNSGKTSLFNALTGLHQHVGNFPGVTIERKTGEVTVSKGQKVTLIDLPGTQTLYPTSEDERVTCRTLWDADNPDHPDKVIVIADATQMRRSLLLCTQVIDLGIPTILALNMIDLLETGESLLDIDYLSKQLGIPVIKVSALKKEGLDQFKWHFRGPLAPSTKSFLTIPSAFRESLDIIKESIHTQKDYLAFQAMLVPEEFGGKVEKGIEDSDSLISNEILVRYDRIDEILKGVWREPLTEKEQFTNRLDRILIHKVWGLFIFLAVLLVIFQALFAWASWPMDMIDQGFSLMVDGLKALLPEGWLTDLITDGLIAGIGGIVIFIPQIAFLFFFIAILEESGYMSRVVFLMDRIMRPFGLSGKSVIPLIGGMACAIPSIMMSRNISDKKERLITILVTPLMSCSARIPVYVLLIGMFVPDEPVLGILNLQGLTMLGLYLLGFFTALIFAFIFKQFLKFRSQGVFLSELPLYRMPRWRNVGLIMFQKSKIFVVEAGKIILVISVVLWFLASYGPGDKLAQIESDFTIQLAEPGLSKEASKELRSAMGAKKLEASYAGILGHFIEPAIRPLGFDWKIGISLITSFAAREVFVGTMSTIYRVGEEGDEGEKTKALMELMRSEKDPITGEPVYNTAVAFALLIFYAFAMQCMSTLAVTQKETKSWKWSIIMVVYLTILAYVASFATYQLLS